VRAAAAELTEWQRLLNRGYEPHRFALCIPNDAAVLPGLLAARAPSATAVAYVCAGTHCEAPITDPAALIDVATGRSKDRRGAV
jgi:hypothetical protein